MTQAIIPGCEANPNPNDVIDVTPDNNEDSKMNNTFDTLLVSAANAADRGKRLDEISQEQSLKIKKLFDENEKLKEECEQLVRRNHELYDEVTRLRNQPALAELNNSCGATLRSVLETVDCKVSVCMDDWFVYGPSGPDLIKKWVCSVNEPLLNRGVKHIGFEATPTLLDGTLTLENMRINIFI